jgi:hypothetical protein
MLALVAAPEGLKKNNLAPIIKDDELLNISNCLAAGAAGRITLETLARGSLPALSARLGQGGCDILYVVAHGSFGGDDEATLWLEDEAGGIAKVRAADLITRLSELPQLPALVVLTSCQSAGAGQGQVLLSLGPRLVEAGVPAVLAMQDNLLMETAARFIPAFFAELQKDGRIDRALSVARGLIRSQPDWWVPVLFSRLSDNSIFAAPPAPQASLGLNALGELAQSSPVVRATLGKFRADFESTCQQIERMADYKDLHDLLHRLQFDYYGMVLSPAKNFPGEDAVDELFVHQPKLDEIISNLRAILQRPSVNPIEGQWGQKLEAAGQEIARALDQADVALLKKGLMGLKHILANQPTRINGTLTESARAMQLSSLIEALVNVASQAASLNLDPAYSAQFAAGIQPLKQLDQQMRTQVDQHDRWQAVENELRNFEGSIQTGELDELKLFWPDVKTTTQTLYANRAEEWAKKLSDSGNALDQAIRDDNPVRIKRAFNDYRSRIGFRFFQVDTDLKKLCSEIREIGTPLNAVLRMIA